jgi:GT2 family glycosyltransferase
MKLSVIIVNYNAGVFIRQCLESVEAFLGNVRHEVCVVDNASTDGSSTLVAEEFPRIRLIANKWNHGFAAALNQGLRQTHGEYVLWLNPDSRLLNEGMPGLLHYLDNNPRVGIVGPLVLDLDGGVQLSCRSFPSYRTYFFQRHAVLTRCFPNNRFSSEYLCKALDRTKISDVDWVSGACLLHRRELIEDIGSLDERFFMYCEDVDFCLRARQRGWIVRYYPGFQVLHHIGGSSRTVAVRMVVERHRSIWRYYAKHFPRNRVKDILIGAGIWGRCGWLLMRGYVAHCMVSRGMSES